jgi:short-subunit dehydrogenase
MRATVSGKVALITGGAQGIGRAIAEALAARGARVVLADVQADKLEATAAELGAASYLLDVTDPEAWRVTVARIEAEVGPVDILVNNAGIMRLGSFLSGEEARDDLQIQVNLLGVMHGMRAVLPGMRARRRGHVVNIASSAGRVGLAFGAVYSATKHAVIGLSEAVRRELEGSGVSLSYVCPAPVRTALLEGTRDMVWPKPVQPEDVANGVLRCLERGAVEVYVPRVARLSVLLPALLPRGIQERIARLLGADRIFADADHEARRTYDAAYTRGADPTEGV